MVLDLQGRFLSASPIRFQIAPLQMFAPKESLLMGDHVSSFKTYHRIVNIIPTFWSVSWRNPDPNLTTFFNNRIELGASVIFT